MLPVKLAVSKTIQLIQLCYHNNGVLPVLVLSYETCVFAELHPCYLYEAHVASSTSNIKERESADPSASNMLRAL